jgi:hypothetical protein
VVAVVGVVGAGVEEAEEAKAHNTKEFSFSNGNVEFPSSFCCLSLTPFLQVLSSFLFSFSIYRKKPPGSPSNTCSIFAVSTAVLL